MYRRQHLVPDHHRIALAWYQLHWPDPVHDALRANVGIGSANDELTLVQTRRSALKPGDTLNLTIDPALVHLFDAATGKRLQATASR